MSKYNAFATRHSPLATRHSPLATRLAFLVLVLLAGAAGADSSPQQAKSPSPLELATTPAPLEESWAVDWWLPRHREKLATKHPGVELLMIGDSITHFWEETGKTVWERHFADVDTLNLGFSGDRTENLLWRLENGEVVGLSPRLAVVMIGTNNTGYRMDPPGVIAAGVHIILDELQTRLPETPNLLLAIFPRGENPDDPMRANNREANNLLEKLAGETGVEFADFNPAFLAGSGVLQREVMPDLLHPNENGYEIWAQQLQPWVAKYLARD